jgi:protein SCO1
MLARWISQGLVVGVALAAASAVWAQQPAPTVGVDESHLGQTLPLDQLTFKDETGQTVSLKSLFDRPVILTLVYFRCPGICTPLLNEVARVVDRTKLTPGQDYRLISISFDPSDTTEIAAGKRETMVGTLTSKQPPLSAWRFLTGDAANIRRITEAAGFNYQTAPNGVDFVHPGTVIFLTSEGKIVRYLQGLQMNPTDLEMAVADARSGRARDFIQNIQELCYGYNTQIGHYTVKWDIMILSVTGLLAVAFLVFALSHGRRRKVLIRRANPG